MPDFGDRRAMGCSRQDIERWLREILGAGAPRFEGDRADLASRGVPLSIVVRDLPPTRVGLLRLHLLEVRFEYAARDAAAARNWITVFDAHTQRGGG